MLEIEGKNKMAKDRAKEGRERAKKLRKASLEKSKGGIGRFFKGVKKALKKDTAKQKAASEARLTPKQRAHKAKASKQRAKKKEGKTWTKAVKAQKKAGTGQTLSSLVKARNAAKASGDKAKYAAAQNQINKAYGSKKVHDPGKPKSLPKKKPVIKSLPKKKPVAKAPKVVAPVSAPSSPAKSGSFPKIEPYPPREDQGPKFAEGGKVESNPYGWPSRDARDGKG
jgi:hypothetical protein